MKALVTGATGFVGSHLVDILRRNGADVTILARSEAKAAPLAALGMTVVRGDLSAHDALARAVDGQDAIFHVAGSVAARNEAEYFRGNRDGTANVVNAAVEAGTNPRLVVVSSMAAGGPSLGGVPRTGVESDRPVTMYGRSKLAAEKVVRASGLPWVILRPPMIYGPRDRDNLIRIFRIARLGVAPVFGDGSQRLSAIYAPDLADALFAAASAPGAVGQTYYANHPEVLTSAGIVRATGRVLGRTMHLVRVPEWAGRGILHLTGAAAALLGRATILNADKANEFFQPAWLGDPSPLERDTGWRAAHAFESGLAETYAWYRSAGWL
ncbi:MAG: NAD-dependent epimerase/dehydratase family protein [Gemmatimonadales bacterium]|nr:NAD-dependent epimerase/dehydratase family protein [Gemmatimonadales bacterium]